jgi:uncharacterized protein (TIGR02996 family)
MLDGEYEWLAAVVANLADDNTKLVYADWLQEQGDADRCARSSPRQRRCRWTTFPSRRRSTARSGLN